MRPRHPGSWGHGTPCRRPSPPSLARKGCPCLAFFSPWPHSAGCLLAPPPPRSLSPSTSKSAPARPQDGPRRVGRPRDAKPKERDVLEVKAGDRVTVQWKLNSTDAKAVLKDVTVHFFAVKEDQAGQPAVPKLDKGVVAETALTMDFGPKDKNESELTFTIDKPGCYLFRVETIGSAAGPAGHEDFAAIDVKAR